MINSTTAWSNMHVWGKKIIFFSHADPTAVLMQSLHRFLSVLPAQLLFRDFGGILLCFSVPKERLNCWDHWSKFFRKIGIQVPYLDLNILKSLLDSEVKVSHIVVILSSTYYCSLDHYCKKKVRESIDWVPYLYSSKWKGWREREKKIY